MPEEPKAPPSKKPATRKKADPGGRKIKQIKDKYRLDAVVNLLAEGPGGSPLGRGPLLDSTAFDKFSELDTTTTKPYLDWMLFQAAGGEKAFENSRKRWGDGSNPRGPEDFLRAFYQEYPNARITSEEVRHVAFSLKNQGVDANQVMELAPEISSVSNTPDFHDKFQAILRVLRDNGVAPGKEERIASDLITFKFKVWIKDQLATKVRDRVHATFVMSRMIRGQSQQEAEKEWKTEIEPKRRHEYLYGDQDALKWSNFGFSRHWPGKENRYERVYEAMKQFLVNKQIVERRNTQIENFNATAAEKNKSLPPEQQIPMREPLKVNMDIGKVLVDKEGNLVYKGNFPTIESLSEITKSINDLPMRERVTNDIRYAGPKGRTGREEKLYSDENLDVLVPLTVAASVRSGHSKWDISNPDQLNQVQAQGKYSASTWMNYASKQHGYPEFAQSQAVPIFFHVKIPGMLKELGRILMIGFLDDLVDLQPPYRAVRWKLAGEEREFRFTELVDYFRKNLDHPTYLKLLRSFSKGIRAVKEWGKEFDPTFLVGDYIKHHRERESRKRHIGEDIKLRAYQAVQAILA